MAFEGFIQTFENGEKVIKPIYLSGEMTWYHAESNQEGTGIKVLSVRSTKESGLQVFSIQYNEGEIERQDDDTLSFQLEPPPEHARLLGATAEGEPPLNLKIDGHDKGPRALSLRYSLGSLATADFGEASKFLKAYSEGRNSSFIDVHSTN